MIDVFIVDDHAMFRDGLRRILDDLDDIRVVGSAESAPAFLSLLGSLSCDVILLDISLGGRNGFDVLLQIQARQPQIAVLMLSMHTDREYVVRTVKAGAAGYISKDAESEQLIRAIRRVADGQKFVTESLAAHLVEEVSGNREDQPLNTLSNREFQIFMLLAKGKPVGDIANILRVSRSTVDTHRKNILTKLEVDSNANLIHYAYKIGILSAGQQANVTFKSDKSE